MPQTKNLLDHLRLPSHPYLSSFDLDHEKNSSNVIFYFWYVLCSYWLVTNKPRAVNMKSYGSTGSSVIGQFW